MYTSNLNVVGHTATGSSFDAAVVGSVLLLDKTLYNAKIAILGRLCPSAAYAYKQKNTQYVILCICISPICISTCIACLSPPESSEYAAISICSCSFEYCGP